MRRLDELGAATDKEELEPATTIGKNELIVSDMASESSKGGR